MTVTDKKLRRIKSQRRTTGEILKNAVARTLKLEGQIKDVASVQGTVVKVQRVAENDPKLSSGAYTITAPSVTYNGQPPFCYGVLVSITSVTTVTPGSEIDTNKAKAVDIKTRADNGDVTITGVQKSDCVISFWGDGFVNSYFHSDI